MFGGLLPRFHIGQIVYPKEGTFGSSEPSYCGPYEKVRIHKIEKGSNGFTYICGHDGYEFEENQLMSRLEYIIAVLKGKV